MGGPGRALRASKPEKGDELEQVEENVERDRTLQKRLRVGLAVDALISTDPERERVNFRGHQGAVGVRRRP